MKVVGFAGYSGSGKTTLVEQLVGLLKHRGLRVSVVKHAHHAFDIDQPGKDSWRHRQAGATEVLVASGRRLALMREFDPPVQWNVHALLARLDASVDWVLVEGFKGCDLPKVEVWRAELGSQCPVRYPDDPHVRAIATDMPPRLPVPTRLPVLDLGQPSAVLEHLLHNRSEFDYTPPVCTPSPT